MATKKKTTTTKKRPATKTSKRSKQSEMKSFRISPEEQPFFTFRLTRQTTYWILISIVILGLALWILKLQAEIQDLYNVIDANTNAVMEMPATTNEN